MWCSAHACNMYKRHTHQTCATVADKLMMVTNASLAYHLNLMDHARFWWSCFVIPIGIVGNIMCLLVVCQKQNRSISFSVYMGGLAVCDTLTLAANGLQTYVLHRGGEMLVSNFIICCKTGIFVFLTSSQCGSMIILALLLERVIVVTNPLKAALQMSPKRSLIIVIIICMLLIGFNIPQPISFTARKRPVNFCTATKGSVVTTHAYRMISLFISGILPLFGILIMNLIILCVIKSSKRSKKKQPRKRNSSKRWAVSEASTSTSHHHTELSTISSLHDKALGHGECAVDDVDIRIKQDSKTVKRENQLTAMTVVMTVAFFICVAPYYVRAWLGASPYLGNVIVRSWASVIVRNLLLLNSAINFFLYAMSGSKFRSDLMTLFQIKRT